MKVTLETEGNIYYYMKFIFVLLKYMQGGWCEKGMFIFTGTVNIRKKDE